MLSYMCGYTHASPCYCMISQIFDQLIVSVDQKIG